MPDTPDPYALISAAAEALEAMCVPTSAVIDALMVAGVNISVRHFGPTVTIDHLEKAIEWVRAGGDSEARH